MPFEWDDAKNKTNRERHGLSFEQVVELFTSGVDFLDIYDENHSDEEDRFVAIGPIHSGVVVVVYTERQDDVIRIINARSATKKEIQLFLHQHLEGKRD
jgi:uncharacterized DUF497 family protein